MSHLINEAIILRDLLREDPIITCPQVGIDDAYCRRVVYGRAR